MDMASNPRSTGVFSVDLASKRYRDFGFAFLPSGSSEPAFPKAKDLGLTDEPTAETCARVLNAFCKASNVSVLLLDGPQGWKHPRSSIEHMRLCERVLNTPGKTGVPGVAKPKTYLRYIQFSIDVFRELRGKLGWELLKPTWHRRRQARWIVETFPSSAWELLGLPRLPSKSKARRADLNEWTTKLSEITGFKLPEKLSHDELQAAVGLPLGRSIAERKPERVILAGVEPLLDPDGIVYEGYIANPRHPET
jgi:hypothetical protein